MYKHWKPTLIALALAPALVLANDPATGTAQDGRPHEMHADKDRNHDVGPMSDQAFLEQAYASGRKEVLGARLAQDTTENTQVRSFAQALERDHRNLNEQLKNAGAKDLPPEQVPDDQVRTQLQTFPKMKPLLDARGADFDRRYVQMQVKMHEKSIAKFESVANGTGNSSQVKQLAQQALPTLRQHLARARTLAASLGPDMAPANR